MSSRKCPKCKGELVEGKRLVGYLGVTLAKKGDVFGDKIIPFYCRNCGYIELYKEIKRQMQKLTAKTLLHSVE